MDQYSIRAYTCRALRTGRYIIALVVALAGMCFGPVALADFDSDFSADMRVNRLIEQQRFQAEMQRIDKIGDRMNRTAQCFLKAAREEHKVPVKKWKRMSEAQQHQFSADIVNECCLQHDCDGM